MEKLELYFVNGRGQMEMNFEALECITSEEFVDYVRHCLEKGELKDVVIESGSVVVYVTSHDDRVLSVYRYDKIYNTYVSMYYNRYDLQKITGFLRPGVAQ